MDPTSACNLKCTGCWAAEYGNHMNLTYEEMDDIVNQGNANGDIEPCAFMHYSDSNIRKDITGGISI